jgi:hypothetical protein
VVYANIDATGILSNCESPVEDHDRAFCLSQMKGLKKLLIKRGAVAFLMIVLLVRVLMELLNSYLQEKHSKKFKG